MFDQSLQSHDSTMDLCVTTSGADQERDCTEPGSLTFAEWSNEISEADGDLSELLSVASRINADSTLGHSEREKLLKDSAKAAGVPKDVLIKDLVDPRIVRGGTVQKLVQVSRGDFAGTVDAAGEILVSIPGIYQRDGELVQVTPLPDRNDVAIAALTHPRLTYLLAKAACWRSGGGGDVTPDERVLSSLLDQGYWPSVRPLIGVLRQPVITLDGSVVGGGYCAELKRLAVFDPTQFPNYTGSGEDAMKDLRTLLSEFAFESPTDEAGFIAGILTAIMRPVLATAPSFLFTAHDKGSGKSYGAAILMALAGASGMGRFPKDETEVAKVLLSKLLEGCAAICFDNLTRPWNSESVAIALTEEIYDDRILGISKNGKVPTAALVIATGNNVLAAGDLARRTVTIKLDPRCENPAGRQFVADPVAELKANRGRWVMTALRVIQAWFESGRPTAKLPPVGGFGQWEIVRQIIVHHGLPDPAACLTRNQNDDEDKELLSRIIQNWIDRFDVTPMTLARAVRDTEASSQPEGCALLEAFKEVAEEKGVVNRRKLGNWFGANSGRVTHGCRLKKVVSDVKHREGTLWTVERV